MGGRGFPPVPTALKMLRGNPGRRPLNKKEPKIPPGLPEAPARLDEVARVEWQRVVKLLAAAGLVPRVDRAGLAAICVLWSRWVLAEEQLRAEGLVIRTGKRGIPRLNPQLGIANTTVEQLRRLLTEFGMTPASRSRIKADVPEPLSKLEAFRRKHDG